jgi:hypothetical protein
MSIFCKHILQDVEGGEFLGCDQFHQSQILLIDTEGNPIYTGIVL